jgi:CRP/FNR family cyclic AMP-dependent transcriptional regulator
VGTLASIDTILQHADNIKTYRSGQIIFKEDDPGDYLYVVKSGEVDIRVRNALAETVRAGGVFGEMALMDKQARSATAVARSDCEVVPIDEKRFLSLVQETPGFALDLMKLLAQRLRTMDQLF